ncbi:MAG: MFS transporter [Streptosporangiaceae bacterium]
MPGTDEKTARAPRRLGGILRQRDFRLFWIGESVSGAGNSMAAIGVPLLAIATLHASTFAVTVLTAAAYLPWLVIGLPAGAWADRLPSRPLMIACDLISAALYASLPLAAWLGVLTIWQTLLVALLAGSANVFFATAYQVYLPSLAADGDLIEGNAKLQGSATVASIGGRGAAGLAAQAVGNATALLFNAASFGVSAACLLAGPRATCYVAGSAVVAAGIVSFNIIAGSFRQAYCPAGMLGRVTVRGALWVVLAANAAAGLLLLTPAIRASRDLPPRPHGK